VTAEDGAQVRSLLEQNDAAYSAILLDWEMPKQTGIDLLRWIKSQRRFQDIPVIMQTAMDSAEQIREGIDAGAFYYLTKPFDARVLLSIVGAALQDFHYKASLTTQLRDCQNPFRLLAEGAFRFRTLDDAERLALWIANSCPEPETAVGIVEILFNAVEHGNLGIGYDEKTRLVEAGGWYAEVERRLALPEFSDRDVQVRIERAPERLIVVVEDRGPGFDWSKYLELDESRAFDNHGRGIAMTRLTMQVEYMGTGNRVRVSIPLHRTQSALESCVKTSA
jgi:CheY-like chemotaxis protein